MSSSSSTNIRLEYQQSHLLVLDLEKVEPILCAVTWYFLARYLVKSCCASGRLHDIHNFRSFRPGEGFVLRHLGFNVITCSRGARLLMSLVVVCAFLLAIPAVTRADVVTGDPEIGLDSGGDALNLSTSINVVQPSGANPLHFSFFNDLDGIVTSLTFNSIIAQNLTDAEIASFGCPTAAHNGYFLSCLVSYTGTTGALQYQFSGVHPSDGDENFPVDGDTEFGEFEGIPIGGTFTITLDGWVAGATAPDGHQLYSNLPTFQNNFTSTPEPSLVWLLAVQFLLLVSIAGVVRRRAKRREHSA